MACWIPLVTLVLVRVWALRAARRPKSWANRVRAILAYEGDPWANGRPT